MSNIKPNTSSSQSQSTSTSSTRSSSDTSPIKGNANPSDVDKLQQGLQKDKDDKQQSTLAEPQGEFAQALAAGADKNALVGKNVDKNTTTEGGDTVNALAAGQMAAQGIMGQFQPNVFIPGTSVASATTANIQSISELASKMTDRILASNADLSAGKQVQLTLSSANPNLKGVDVIIQKTDNGINVQFVAPTDAAANYIAQNQNTLNNQLRQDLPNAQINIDISKQDTNTGGDPRKSKGEYIPEQQD